MIMPTLTAGLLIAAFICCLVALAGRMPLGVSVLLLIILEAVDRFGK